MMDISGVMSTATKPQPSAGKGGGDGTGTSGGSTGFAEFLASTTSLAASGDSAAQMTNALIQSLQPTGRDRDETGADTDRDLTMTDDRAGEAGDDPGDDRVEDRAAEAADDEPRDTARDDDGATEVEAVSETEEEVVATVAPDQDAAPATAPAAALDEAGPAAEVGTTGAATASDVAAAAAANDAAPPAAAGAAAQGAASQGVPAAAAAAGPQATAAAGNAAPPAEAAGQTAATEVAAATVQTAAAKSGEKTQGPVTAPAEASKAVKGEPQGATQTSAQQPGAVAAKPSGQAAGDASAAAKAQAESLARSIGEAGQDHTVKVQVASQAQGAATQTKAPQAQAAQADPAQGVDGTAGRVVSAQNASYYSGQQGNAGGDGQGRNGGGTLGQQTAQHMADAQTPQAAAGPANAARQPSFQAEVKAAAGTAAEAAGRGAGQAAAPPAAAATTTTTTGTAPLPSADGLPAGQGQGPQSSAQTARAEAPQPPPRQPATQAQVTEQVKVKIAQTAAAGKDTVKIQLKPADLGRVDVKLHMQDGRVTAHVTAEHRDTLDMLKADSRGLEQALKDAGLKTDGDSLSFSLRGDGQQTAQNGGQGDGRGRRSLSPYGDKAQSLGDDLDLSALDVDGLRATSAAARGGIDVRV
jgi:flagellar hook-length control protein FliK